MKTNIILIGMMGVGKTTLANQLSQARKMQFVDMDSCIEKNEGRTISLIFQENGETYFRDLEKKYLYDFKGRACVISTGGGVVIQADNRRRLKELGTVIYLKASPDTLFKRLESESHHRPMLRLDSLKDRLVDLLDQRESLYQETADYILEVDDLSKKETFLCLSKLLDEIGL